MLVQPALVDPSSTAQDQSNPVDPDSLATTTTSAAGHVLGASDAEMAEGDAPTPAATVLPVVNEQQPKPRRSVD